MATTATPERNKKRTKEINEENKKNSVRIKGKETGMIKSIDVYQIQKVPKQSHRTSALD